MVVFEVDDGRVATATLGEVRLVSVNVGRPREIGRLRNGEAVVSGIVKERVAAATLFLDVLNLEGDGQADLSVHGGPDKAVYAYPAEHVPRWNEELGTAFGPGTFGENLTVEGLREGEVRIGDVWAWGEARLQVTQPRSPCYKLAMVTGRPDIGKRMVRNGRTGWYLRVLAPGRVPTAGPIRVVERDGAGITVERAHRALLLGEAGREELATLAGLEPMAASWREWAAEELARA
jgi:MOSC domain-containing protein YiiM